MTQTEEKNMIICSFTLHLKNKIISSVVHKKASLRNSTTQFEMIQIYFEEL